MIARSPALAVAPVEKQGYISKCPGRVDAGVHLRVLFISELIIAAYRLETSFARNTTLSVCLVQTVLE
jgi:hypothetical protein